MSPTDVSPAPQTEADRLYAALMNVLAADVRAMADLLAAKADHDLLGPTEFQLRDLVHRAGATALQAALAERKKGGTMGPPAPARTAARRPSSSAGSRRPS
jgi:hypothetical protein